MNARQEAARNLCHAQLAPLSVPLSVSVRPSVCVSVYLEGWSHGSLLCELLGVQRLSKRWCLIGVGGYYGSSVGNGVRCSSSVSKGWIQVLPCKHIGVAAG